MQLSLFYFGMKAECFSLTNTTPLYCRQKHFPAESCTAVKVFFPFFQRLCQNGSGGFVRGCFLLHSSGDFIQLLIETYIVTDQTWHTQSIRTETNTVHNGGVHFLRVYWTALTVTINDNDSGDDTSCHPCSLFGLDPFRAPWKHHRAPTAFFPISDRISNASPIQ